MKKYQEKAMIAKVVCFTGVIMLFSLFSGCRKIQDTRNKIQQAGDKSAWEMDKKKEISLKIENALFEKYQLTFEVHSLNEINGMTALDAVSYQADVTETGKNQYFIAYYDKTDDTVKDTYAQLMYDEQIKERILDVFEGVYEKEDYSYEIIYWEDSRIWTQEKQLEEYLAESNTYIDIELKIETKDFEQDVKKVYGLAKELESAGFKYSIKLEYGEQVIYIGKTKEKELLTYEQLIRKMNGN